MIIPVSPGHDPYDVILERGCLSRAGALLALDRRALIVTDENIPEAYVRAVALSCARPTVVTVAPGEGSKCFAVLQALLERMLREGFTRGDCVVSVGGGMVGDLAGFAASMYMRGVDYYNVPTTLLSQVDASVGGKTAINLGGVKNVVGAFYQPRRVLIDPDTTATLPRRQLASGLAEALKTGAIADAALFEIFERGEAEQRLDEVIARSVAVKSDVVSRDEKEQGLRRILNFGHTLGHGIEALEGLHGLHHGECVALGMLPMCAPAVRARLEPVLERLGLPTALDFDPEAVMAAVVHDKKSVEGGVTCVLVDEIGACRLEKKTPAQLRAALETIRENKA